MSNFNSFENIISTIFASYTLAINNLEKANLFATHHKKIFTPHSKINYTHLRHT